MNHGQLLVFDLDGVLIDSSALMRHAFSSACAQSGVENPPVMEEFLKHLGRPLPDIARLLGLPVGFVCAYESVSKVQMDLVTLQPGMLDVLAQARRQFGHMAVMTGKDRYRTLLLLKRFGLDLAFDELVCGDDPYPGKPNPAGLVALCVGVGAEPDQTAMIGDSPIDIQCGLAAGAYTVGAAWGFCSAEELRAANANCVLARPEDLLAWLTRRDVATHRHCHNGQLATNRG